MYSKKELIDKIESVHYIDRHNGKIFYSLKEVFNEFNLTDFENFLVSTNEIYQKLNKLSYPLRTLFQAKKVKDGKLDDVYVNPVGLMFAFAQYSVNAKDEHEKNICYEIAKILKENQTIFYPEKRMLARKAYSDTTKALRHKVKEITLGDRFYSLSTYLNKMYYTILSDYYFITDTDSIMRNKIGDPNAKYLDYITVRELKDLTEIQKTILEDLEKYPSMSIVDLAKDAACKKHVEFIKDYAGISPLKYRAHSNKPSQMLKEFNNLLKELKLDNITLLDDKNTYEK